MNRRRRPRRSPAWPAVMGLALALGATPFAGFAGAATTPHIVIAADPSPDPSSLPSDPLATPDPSPTPDPTAAPTAAPAPTSTFTPEPSLPPGSGAAPTPGVTPAPSPDTTGTATATPTPAATPALAASPGPTPLPPIFYTLSAGQQQGSLVTAAIPIYKLASSLGIAAGGPHDGTGVAGTACAACHAAHTSQQADLLRIPDSQAAVCFACHGPGQSAMDVQTAIAAAPANEDATDRYFSHPVTGVTLGAALTCSDCHNPHLSGSARPVQTTSGWTASGAISAAGGVAAANGEAGAAPTLTPIEGDPLTYEYELCLKCHAGATTLPVRDAGHPSWWALDAGIEFNPANASYHPVEAPGRNISAQMAASLAGTSPYKAWTFGVDSTIRCTSCHGDPSTLTGTTPPAADALESSHASANRGLLIAPYRDRLLKAAGEGYRAEDFALCFLCHAERPFADPNKPQDPLERDTAFPLHGFHLTSITGSGVAGASIDTAGAGAGVAICAECHFRDHSTALAYRPGDTRPVARGDGGAGLVNFAPNVEKAGLLDPAWVQPDASGTGSCTLTCHGVTHDAGNPRYAYTVAPATGFTADVTTGAPGLTVQFTDATRYAAPTTATWSWDFGDPGSSDNASTAQSPSHVYRSAGTYTVTLTVQRLASSGNTLATTMTRTGYITVAP